MITLKTADRDLENGIRKGETYLSFTGKDRTMIERAAKKLHMPEEELLDRAMTVFFDDHNGVCGVACNNADAGV
jgi:hypothetical protein